MIELSSTSLWSDIKALSSTARRTLVAVAYVSDDSEVQFRKGDLLVVDASDAAVASKETSPAVLARALDKGATIYSLPGLHAKLMVFDDTVVVGSANISKSSQRTLHEAGVVSDSPQMVSAALETIARLQGQAEIVDRAFIRRIRAIPAKSRSDDGPGGKPPRGKRKLTLLEALQEGSPLLNDFVFTFYEEGTTLTQGRVRKEAKRRELKLPPSDRWAWYEDDADPALVTLHERLFVERRLKALALDVETEDGRFVKIVGLHPYVEVFVHQFKVGGQLVTNFLDDPHAPFNLKGKDAKRLCAQLTQAVRTTPQIGRRLYARLGWVIRPKDLLKLLPDLARRETPYATSRRAASGGRTARIKTDAVEGGGMSTFAVIGTVPDFRGPAFSLPADNGKEFRTWAISSGVETILTVIDNKPTIKIRGALAAQCVPGTRIRHTVEVRSRGGKNRFHGLGIEPC